MALGGVNSYNYNNQQIDEYDYDDADDFYDDNINSFNSINYNEVDDSEGKQLFSSCELFIIMANSG